MKKTLVIIIAVIAVLSAVISYFCFHPTFYKYNDAWIIGRSIDEVEERYGEFDLDWDYRKGYYIYNDDRGFLPDGLDHYYYMEYDENGIVYEVYDSCQMGG